MADDTVAYLEQEVDVPAHLVGWSDGAVVALLVAQRRPDLVARMVLIGQYFNSSGRAAGDELVASLNSPEAITFLRRAYDPVSPDGPDHFPIEHSLAVVAALPEARLAVPPGTHTLPLEHPELVNPLIQSFLRNTDPTPDWNAFTGG
jgi:pimeloyl-ACP methyl ester carboxylesterase